MGGGRKMALLHLESWGGVGAVLYWLGVQHAHEEFLAAYVAKMEEESGWEEGEVPQTDVARLEKAVGH